MVSGMTHMEWFRRADGSIAISEVAARPPGAQFTSSISYAHDRDFYRVWAEVSILEEFARPAAQVRDRRRVPARPGRRASGARGRDRAGEPRSSATSSIESQLPVPGQLKASSYEGEGYIILRHEDTDRVREGLRRAVEILQVELSS